jgi:4-diphosphocytidyl-2-C-methyl-D-erythritol kinase
MSVQILCPAKLNLFLAVGPIDHRKYHPIRSIFQAVSLYDELELTPSSELTFECDDPSVFADNTVTKACRLLMEVVDFPPVHAKLTKRIPSEAGLGGGSSDAAGVLRLSKQLMTMAMPLYEQKAIAKAIGADVTFFLTGGRAKVQGYGEQVTKIESPNPVEWYVIAQPEDRCSTAEAYSKLDSLSYEWKDFPAEDALYNDFERAAPCGSLELLDRLLVHGARDSGLTGSGSAVFGRFSSEDAATRAADRLQSEAPFVAVAHSL